jgi:S1-C subfamily serine protease
VPRARAATAADGEAIEAREWMLTARVVGEGEESIEGYYRPKGLAVLAVVPRGNAERSGLEADDIFLDVDGVEIKSLEDFRRVYEKSLRRAGVDRLILATVLRRGLLLKIALDFSRPRAAQETP